MLNVEIIATSELGDRSYIVHDGRHGIVIDPQRDIDRIESYLNNVHVQPLWVLETHIHNDYVSGGLALSRKTGASYGVIADVELPFEHHGLGDEEILTCGALTVEVIATPGHTQNHLAYLVRDDEKTVALFSGGSLLYGSVGRTDLLGEALTEELTHAQYRSAQRLASTLGDNVLLFPTHGFGSFCSSGETTGDNASTIGIERRRNDALTQSDEDAFVHHLIANLGAYPSYYAHMGPLNIVGQSAPDLGVVEKVDTAALASRIRAGEWVIDLRNQRIFAKRHLAGTISIGIGNNFSTYVGWIIPWDSPITLIAQNQEQVHTAQRQLVRIGIDHLAGAANGAIDELAPEIATSTYRVVSFAELPPLSEVTILDVRRYDERAQGYIVGSLHVPLQELFTRIHELPDTTLWVHCASGYRAAIAASLLERAGCDVVLIDDDFAAVAALSLPIIR